ncbi:MAG: hypothetical protein L3J41_01255 [Melioribacteraceae bacterium]|nr:hypothetical protein [Melioribacteraceae bacterium]
MKCQVCKYDNQENAKFCENCGHMLEDSNPNGIQKKRKKKKGRRAAAKEMEQAAIFKKLFTTKSLWIGATIVVGAFLIISIINSNASRNSKNNDAKFIEQRNTNPLVEAKVFDIASKFVCGCGGCDEDPLEHCKCNYAVAQREFIRDRVENSESDEKIIAAVTAKYGNLKNESEQGLKAAAKLLASERKFAEKNDNVVATYSDLDRIYNSFECPCGQCGIKELADCTCGHNNGAIEVKKFIDVQIAKNKLTVEQVIAEVDRVYGGKKF